MTFQHEETGYIVRVERHEGKPSSLVLLDPQGQPTGMVFPYERGCWDRIEQEIAFYAEAREVRRVVLPGVNGGVK